MSAASKALAALLRDSEEWGEHFRPVASRDL